MTTPHRKMLASDALPPIVPSRLREALVHVVDDAVAPPFAGEVGEWLYSHRDQFRRIGDASGERQFGFGLADVDQIADIAPLKARLSELCADGSLLESTCTPPFDMTGMRFRAELYHHGGHQDYVDSASYSDGSIEPANRLAFALFLAAEPVMFHGGGLEFVDGRTVEGKNNRLAIWHPSQRVRVRRVECWSASFLHGSWMLRGEIQGPAPDGYAELLLRIIGASR